MNSIVYFTKDLSSSSLLRLYKKLNKELKGNVAIKLHSGEPGNQNFLRPDFFKEIIDYVIKQGSAQTTVSDLAELMKMRTDVFSRNFTRETGLTPKQFLSRSLVRKACELLKHGKTNREIAVILKFNNEFYFSHFFKKMIGIPPSLYSTQNQ